MIGAQATVTRNVQPAVTALAFLLSMTSLRFEESRTKNARHRPRPRAQTVGNTGPAGIEKMGLAERTG